MNKEFPPIPKIKRIGKTKIENKVQTCGFKTCVAERVDIEPFELDGKLYGFSSVCGSVAGDNEHFWESRITQGY